MSNDAIVRSLRAQAALDSTYSRGSKLFREGAVLSFAKKDGGFGQTIGVTGRVKGSGGAYYSVGVDLDLGAGDVIDFSCTCPASAQYSGMCKHEIALALAATADGAAEGGAADPRPVATPASLAPAARKAPARPAYGRGDYELPTSSGINELLGRATMERLRKATERRARPRGAEPVEPARLLAELGPQEGSLSGAGVAIRLSVQRGKAKYVVKSVARLVDACRTGEEIVYGKNLRLFHVPGEFDERSWELVRVLTRIVDAQSALFNSRWSYSERGRGADVRALPLSDADVIAVLDVFQGSSILMQPIVRGSYFHVKGDDVPVLEGDPRLSCSLEPDARGGLDVRLGGEAHVIADGGSCYVLTPSWARRTSPEFAAQAAPVLKALASSYMHVPAHVARKDVPEFCRAVLPALRAWTDLDAPAELDGLVPPEPQLSFRVGIEDGEVVCDARVSYGDWTCLLGAQDGLPGQPARDLAVEYHAQDVLDDYFPESLGPGDYRFGEDDEELLFTLLTEGLGELSELGEVMLSDRLRSINVRPAPSLSVRATVKSNLLDVELGASGMSKEELFEYLAGFKRKQRYVRLSSGDLVRMGENLKVARELADGLGVDIDTLAAGDVGLPSARALLIDALLDRAQSVRLERDAGFRRIVRDFDSFADADVDVPAGLKAELRGYQEDGFRWLWTLERLGFGGILADDMGLGKTLQVIAHILACKEAGVEGPTLVVCPASLVYNWMSEVARFAPTLDACAVLGNKTARTALIGGALSHDVVVTSYDLLRRDVELYASKRFARVVLDEAQYIKNPRAQVTRAVKCLDAGARFALTGTPIENRLAELWSIFDFLMPGYLGTREGFAKRYEGPVEAREHDGQRLLQCAIGPFVLRRLKSEVLADLPEKTESVVYAQMGAKQKKLYLAEQDRVAMQVQHTLSARDEDRGFGREKLKILAELTKLRQVCCDPRLYFEGYDGGSAKLDTCLELVSQAVDGGHKVLLFSQFTSMLDILADSLAEKHLSYFMLTGSTSKEERERLVRRFQAGEADVFLISLKAGGVGLNLTAADVVIHYDPWWNVAAQDQATDRAHRIGQRRDVTVFKLIVEGTIEERILAMQESKRGLAESVLGGEAVKSSLLTREDLLRLLDA